MPRKIVLTPDQERQFRELWLAGEPVSRICETFSLAADTVNRVRGRLGLLPRTARTRAARRAPRRDPTPDEIEAMLVELRAKHLAKRRAEPEARRYRDDDDYGGRVYPASVFDPDG